MCDFLEELTDTFRINVGFVGDGDQLICYCIDRTKNIETFASTRSLEHDPRKTPQKAKIGLEDKMCRIYEEDRS